MTRHLGVSAVLFCFLPCFNAFANTEGIRAPLIAVLDSGIDGKDAELAAHLVSGRDFTGKGSALVDEVGHGTAMARLVLFGAEGLQGCGGCRLMPVRVTNGPQVNLTLLARAIRWASDEGAGVVLTALGAPAGTPELAEAVDYAANSGVTVVAPIAASGSTQPLFPGSLSSVVSVAALSWAGQRLDQAPVGADILVPAFRIALDNKRTVSGGSAAAALAAAQIVRGDWQVADSTSLRTSDSESPSGPVYARLQYADTDDEDVIIDAPWRTIRDYVPVLIFTAEFESPKDTLTAF